MIPFLTQFNICGLHKGSRSISIRVYTQTTVDTCLASLLCIERQAPSTPGLIQTERRLHHTSLVLVGGMECVELLLDASIL